MHKLLPRLAVALFILVRAHAAISVGPGGSGVLTFGTLPGAAEWSTRSLAGSETSFANAAALDAAVQTNHAATITNTLLDGLGAVPPGQNTLASWSGGGAAALWTRPAANSATLLLATLQNNTGEDQTVAGISYTISQSGTTPAEQAPAHEVFYSLTGADGTWVKIPALSGGGPGVRSVVVALNGVWASGAPLFLLWADDNTTGGVDRGYALDDVTFTGRPPPVLEAIPDVVTDVLRPVFLRVAASNSVPGGRLLYLLDAGAPTGARVNPTNGVFVWQPSRADAGTTNLITVRATDADAPGSSAARPFTVVVKDYVELSLGRVVMLGGSRSNLILEAVASTPVTNLQLALVLPTNRLAATLVENLAPFTATLVADDSQPGRVALKFSALPGQLISGSQTLARVSFTAVPEPPSAFVPLNIENASATRATPGLAPTLLLNAGRVVIVNREPLVEGFTDGGRSLTLYGRPGTNYTIESAPGPLGLWQPQVSVTLESLFTHFDTSTGTNASGIFYRAVEGASLPPVPALSQKSGVNIPAKAVKTKKSKKPKKPRLSAARHTQPSPVVPSR